MNIGRGIRHGLVVCVMSLSFGATTTFAVGGTKTTSMQEKIAQVSVKILSKSLLCPMPPIIVDWEDDGGYRITDLVTKTYAGDEKTFKVAGKNERHYYNEDLNRAGRMRRAFKYRVNFADLASAEITKNPIRVGADASRELVNSTVVISCDAGSKCIHHELMAPKCSMHSFISGRCDHGVPVLFRQNMLSKMSIELCDAKIARIFKVAVKQLIQLSQGTKAIKEEKNKIAMITPQKLPKPSPTPHPEIDQGGFRICNKTGSHVGVAIGYKKNHDWVTEGWWNIVPRTCEALLRGVLQNRYYYLYAVDYDKGGEWSGHAYMCTRDKEFTIHGNRHCLARGYGRTGFFEVDTRQQRSWTVQLTDNAESAPEKPLLPLPPR